MKIRIISKENTLYYEANKSNEHMIINLLREIIMYCEVGPVNNHFVIICDQEVLDLLNLLNDKHFEFEFDKTTDMLGNTYKVINIENEI